MWRAGLDDVDVEYNSDDDWETDGDFVVSQRLCVCVCVCVEVIWWVMRACTLLCFAYLLVLLLIHLLCRTT